MLAGDEEVDTADEELELESVDIDEEEGELEVVTPLELDDGGTDAEELDVRVLDKVVEVEDFTERAA